KAVRQPSPGSRTRAPWEYQQITPCTLKGQGFQRAQLLPYTIASQGLRRFLCEANPQMLPPTFDAFIQRRPIAVMAQAVLENLFQPDRLDALFAQTAEKQYQRTLLFSSVVELMHAVVLCVEPSVFAAYRHRRHTLKVSDQAVYNKLDGMELGLSAALVRDSAQQATQVIEALRARREPWLPTYRIRILDGNHLSATEHRLEELRTTWAAPLPGKILVVLEPETGLATDAF